MKRLAYFGTKAVWDFVRTLTGQDDSMLQRVIIDITHDGAVMVYTVGLAEEDAFRVGIPNLEPIIEEVDAKEE